MEHGQWPLVRDSLVKQAVSAIAVKAQEAREALANKGLNSAEMRAESALVAALASAALERATEYSPMRYQTACPRCWVLYRLNEPLVFTSDVREYVGVACGRCGLELYVSTPTQ